jgi:FkbM family methyltransferase
MKLKRIIKKVIPNKHHKKIAKIKNKSSDSYAIKSYSQEGEDMILRRIFEKQRKGFYIDIGAHHPRRFSNTHYFYKQGWNGMNIEPNPEVKRLFDKVRKRDINLQLGVAEKRGRMTYYVFNDPGLNSFSQPTAQEIEARGNYRIIKKLKIEVLPLSEILNEHIPEISIIDFLNIDVEGLDYQVLKSNNWEKYRPKVVLVEERKFDLENTNNSIVIQFLRKKGYNLFAKTVNTLIFKENSYEK